MKGIHSLFTFSLLILILFTSCNGKNKTTSSSSEIPEVLKHEKLLETHDFKIIDTTENGILQTVQFFDESGSNNLIIEKKYYNSGHVFMEGSLKNGKRDGEWVAWYDNGVKWSIGHYKDGIKDGIEEAYYENGTIRYSKNYINNYAEGLAKFYDANGVLMAEVMYENNKVLWEKQYNE